MTKIDWSKAPEGATSFNLNFYKTLKGDVFFFSAPLKEWVHSEHTLTEVSKFIKRPTKPLYTKQMQEAGELPQVGMEVMIKNKCDAHPQFKKATIKYISDLVIYSYVEHGERCDSHINLAFKPLTPPIELIDGKAYQFDYRSLVGINGVYSSADNSFYNAIGAPKASKCTNIQLLEVKS